MHILKELRKLTWISWYSCDGAGHESKDCQVKGYKDGSIGDRYSPIELTSQQCLQQRHFL